MTEAGACSSSVTACSKRCPIDGSSRANLTDALKNIARACGDEISEEQPLLDARLEDGSRVAAVLPPCAVTGPILTIRKFTTRYSLDDLVRVGTLAPPSRGRSPCGHRDTPEHPGLRTLRRLRFTRRCSRST